MSETQIESFQCRPMSASELPHRVTNHAAHLGFSDLNVKIHRIHVFVGEHPKMGGFHSHGSQ
jgi:hypothetical protein